MHGSAPPSQVGARKCHAAQAECFPTACGAGIFAGVRGGKRMSHLHRRVRRMCATRYQIDRSLEWNGQRSRKHGHCAKSRTHLKTTSTRCRNVSGSFQEEKHEETIDGYRYDSDRGHCGDSAKSVCGRAERPLVLRSGEHPRPERHRHRLPRWHIRRKARYDALRVRNRGRSYDPAVRTEHQGSDRAYPGPDQRYTGSLWLRQDVRPRRLRDQGRLRRSEETC